MQDRKNNLFNFLNNLDKFIFVSVILLMFVGIFAVFSASTRIDEKYDLLFKKHLIFCFLGFFIICFLSSFSIKNLIFISIFFFCFSLILSLLTIVFFRETKGASRWIRVLGFSFQPSEIIKPSFISNIQGSDKLYKNTNKLIKDDYIGLKTGWTNEAGLTFIGLNQTNNRNILTIVNKSIVNENKDNHFIDTKILYKESIENFDKISIIDKDQDIYQVRNNSKAKIIKSTQDWSMFANKSSQNTIYLENFNIDKLQFKTNDEKLSIKIVDTEDKILWKFDFLKLLKLIANQ